jgi:hypothetical protein
MFQLILDFINFFLQVKNFGTKSAFADLALVAIASVFLMTDWFYPLWVFSLSFRLPDSFAGALSNAMFGMIEGIHDKIGEALFKKK